MTDSIEKQIVALIILIFGILNLVYPKQTFEIRKKWAALLGVKMSGSERTWNYYRIVGVVLIVVSIILFTSQS